MVALSTFVLEVDLTLGRTMCLDARGSYQVGRLKGFMGLGIVSD